MCKFTIDYLLNRIIMRLVVKTRKDFMMNTSKKSFKQKIRDLLEMEAYAVAMAYAGSKGDYEMVRALENRLH